MDEKAAENRFFFLLKLQAFFFLASQRARRVGGAGYGRDSARVGWFGWWRCAADATKLLQLLVG
jgi:hypothetical protein